MARDRPAGDEGRTKIARRPWTIRAALTGDVVERDDGGRKTRGRLRAIEPLDRDEVAANRRLVTRRRCE